MVLVAVLLLILPYAGAVHLARYAGGSVRDAALVAAVGCGVALTALTVILSALGLLTVVGAAVGWAAFATLLWTLALRSHRVRRGPTEPRPHFAGIERPDRFLLAGVLVVVGLVGLIALIAPPNTWDALTYRMSRVVHWVQNGGVQPYPTHILRQIHRSPWAEYAVLHLQLLSGSDALANTVQWLSLIGCAVAASCLARELGAGSRGQVFAVVAVATLPMAMLQGSSTQNDLVVAFWLACFVLFVLQALRRECGPDLATELLIGASLGLALLTKATAYVFAFPFLLWFIVARLRRGAGRSVAGLLRVAAVVLVLNASLYAQNFSLFGSPLGPTQEGEFRFSNELIGWGVVASNLLRNAALHLSTPLPSVNRGLENAIVSAHDLLGVDAHDPRTTWAGTQFEVGLMIPSENTAGNPLHLVLGLLCVAVVLWAARRGGERTVVLYAGMLTAGFVLFCAYLQWQPWHARLHLPLFVLGAALLGQVAGRYAGPRLTRATGAMLIVAALPWALFNLHRPLITVEPLGLRSILTVDRAQQYFVYDPSLMRPYQEAARFVAASGCDTVGLVLGPDTGEYLFWVALRRAGAREIHLEHIEVANVTARLTRREVGAVPCAIVRLDADERLEPPEAGLTTRRTWTADEVRVTVELVRPEPNPRSTSQVEGE